MMKKTKKALLCTSVIALLVAFSACSNPSDSTSDSKGNSSGGSASQGLTADDVIVSFAKETLLLTVNETTELKATVGEKLDGLTYSLGYSSSEPSVLAVADDGFSSDFRRRRSYGAENRRIDCHRHAYLSDFRDYGDLRGYGKRSYSCHRRGNDL